MDSSDEESFVWAEVSNTDTTDSDVSGEMQPLTNSDKDEIKQKKETKTLRESKDLDDSSYETKKEVKSKKKKYKKESETNEQIYDSSYETKTELKLKKKKHKVKSEDNEELYDSNYDTKNEVHNDMSKTKKNKRKRESEEFEESGSPKKKKIKTELLSDTDADTKKKKTKRNQFTNGSIESFNNEDDYLNMRVKQEKERVDSTITHTSMNIKNHDNTSFDANSSVEVHEYKTIEKKSKKKKELSKYNNEKEQTSVNGQINNDEKHITKEKIRKSPKKKKHSESGLSELQNSNHIDVDEQLAEEDQKKPKQNDTEAIHYKQNGLDNDSNVSDDEMVSSEGKNTSMNNILENRNSPCHNIHTNNTFSEEFGHQESINEAIPTIISKRIPKLSDRIKFEDKDEPDVLSDSHIISQENDVGTSAPMTKVLNESSSLSLISNESLKDSDITENDEIWLMNCPHDFDINILNNSDLNLDNKCKIKMNGETYCGSLEDGTGSSKINILSFSKKEFKIKNVTPTGIIYFKKRLPKPHYYEENIMVNNQTDFIPLPETKMRHPLFGSNYQDVINVQIDRLNRPSNHSDTPFISDKKKKKKHKKSHDSESESKHKIEHDSEVSNNKANKEFYPDIHKKSTKRKHSEKKSKKIKHEPDSAEAWESEKAIEENLFNF